ncbi:F0F1 ATP synthase subunit B [Helicobacter mustelae]|uniref:ATP synthase subunit b n=1 Tax=Helicobacter mustelae (strain ATCC 43772 / CCUG 25715 / CIP 103759 / LMG 18044 / NCTC 12198 / R85-136P) TaxID=679897 RepID=D3UGS2_HELM1|nr:F0F1 ATP synthase subunit B [Helicobacter mustelae]CBG39693.1 ATP synthase F0 sector B subunit [Helicobacter mustelae 12198]SQH71199.1 ATP synthase F0 subunit B [Helicobacter mustelae]STP12326.1 ATP synthase F0 subunit B [Helicobacter mustelae]
MRFVVLSLASLCALFGASEHLLEVEFADSDFIARLINFVIFVAIVWLLLAKRMKMFFGERKNKISQKLLEVQERLKVAKSNKEQALRKLEEARERANKILANAKKESYTITQKIEQQSSADIENMMKSVENLMEFEQKKMEKEVVMEVLDEVFGESKINSQEYVKILEKKVV